LYLDSELIDEPDPELINKKEFPEDPFLQYAIKNKFFSNNFSDQFGENSFEKFLEHYIKKPNIFLYLIKNMDKDEIISVCSSNNHEKNNMFHKLALNCEFSFDTKDLEINFNKSKKVDFSEDSNSRNQRKAIDANINSHASYEITNYQEALFSLLLINGEGLLNEKNSDGLKPYEVCIKNSNYFLARLLKGETDIFEDMNFKIDPEKDIQKLINENIYLNLRKKISDEENHIFFKKDIGEDLELIDSDFLKELENNNNKKLVHLFIESLPIKNYNHSKNYPKLETKVNTKEDKEKIFLKEPPKNKMSIIINNLLVLSRLYLENSRENISHKRNELISFFDEHVNGEIKKIDNLNPETESFIKKLRGVISQPSKA